MIRLLFLLLAPLFLVLKIARPRRTRHGGYRAPRLSIKQMLIVAILTVLFFSL